jgi:hypothetical protein
MNSRTEMTAATAETARIVGGVSTSQQDYAVQAQAELFRQYQGFAEPVAVPDDAPAFDRALAVSGRDPALAKS